MTSREIIFMTFAIKERRRLGVDLSPEVFIDRDFGGVAEGCRGCESLMELGQIWLSL
jgi:hypothetical protein